MVDTHTDAGGGADFDLTQFYQIFFEEAGENLDQMEQMLLNLDCRPPTTKNSTASSVVRIRSKGALPPLASPMWPS